MIPISTFKRAESLGIRHLAVQHVLAKGRGIHMPPASVGHLHHQPIVVLVRGPDQLAGDPLVVVQCLQAHGMDIAVAVHILEAGPNRVLSAPVPAMMDIELDIIPDFFRIVAQLVRNGGNQRLGILLIVDNIDLPDFPGGIAHPVGGGVSHIICAFSGQVHLGIVIVDNRFAGHMVNSLDAVQVIRRAVSLHIQDSFRAVDHRGNVIKDHVQDGFSGG